MARRPIVAPEVVAPPVRTAPRFVPVHAVRFERIGWYPGAEEHPDGSDFVEVARDAIVQVFVAAPDNYDPAGFEAFVDILRAVAQKVIVIPHREEKVVAAGKVASLIGDGSEVMTPRAAINALLEKARAEDAAALREHVELIAEEAGL